MLKICSFSSCHERGTKKKKILSPHEESNLRPSDSALLCSDESDSQGSIPRGDSEFFSLSHARDKTKKKHLFYVFTELKNLPFLLFLSTSEILFAVGTTP